MKELFRNVSNAFIGTLDDIGKRDTTNKEQDVNENDYLMRSLLKENRYMYLALLVLFLLILSNIFFTTE
jgi:hypothetical protein